MNPSALGLMSTSGQDGLSDVSEIEWLPLFDAALAGGQGEQCLDESLLVFAEGEGLLAGRPQGVGVGVRVGEGDFQEGSLAGERGAQLVGGVGHEVALRLERGFEAPEEVIEGVAELGELVVGPARPRRRCRLVAEISCAAAFIARSGRRKRPAIHHASPARSARRSRATIAGPTSKCVADGGRCCDASRPPLTVRRSAA